MFAQNKILLYFCRAIPATDAMTHTMRATYFALILLAIIGYLNTYAPPLYASASVAGLVY